MEASREPYDSKALFNSLLSGCQDDSDSDGSSPDSPPSPNKGATTNGSPSPALNSVLNSGSVVSSASSVTNPADLAPIYRIGGQPVVSLAGAVAGGASSSGCSPATVTVLPGSQSSLGTLMYQTPQGLLYAAPPGGSLPEALLLNLSQPVSLKTDGDCPTQQYITIPVPVSMAQQQAGSASSSSSSKRERTGK